MLLLDDSLLNRWHSLQLCLLSYARSGLFCFEREAGQEVPGCQGGDGFDSRADYCIPQEDAKTMEPSVADTMADTAADTMADTVAETMSMSEAAAALLLSANEFIDTAVPSTSVPTEIVMPLGTLAVVGQNGSPNRFFPLGHCQGDCDNDNEVGLSWAHNLQDFAVSFI
jgi:hypothetical protein